MNYKKINEIIQGKPFLLEHIYLEEEKPVEKFLRYRESNDGIDIDVSIFNIMVYISCFDYICVDEYTKIERQPYRKCEHKYQIKCRENDDIFRGDTAINSMSIIMQIVNYEKDKISKRNVGEIRSRISNSYILDTKCRDREEVTIGQLLEEHIRLCYGVGNFYPIPFFSKSSLNVAKGRLKSKGYNGTMFDDNMYVFLNVIYQYMVEDRRDFCETVRLLDSKYQNWINQFGIGLNGWDNFICKNFFDAFVDSKNLPKRFWCVSENGIIYDVEMYLKKINSALRERERAIMEAYHSTQEDRKRKVEQLITCI